MKGTWVSGSYFGGGHVSVHEENLFWNLREQEINLMLQPSHIFALVCFRSYRYLNQHRLGRGSSDQQWELETDSHSL